MPLVAIGALVSGLATPTESAALTAGYAVLTQALAHRELDWRLLGRCLADCAMPIGGVMLILGMALALANYLVDTGVPDAAATWVQGAIPNKNVFLLPLCLFLFAAAALMEIYAALVMLVPKRFESRVWELRTRRTALSRGWSSGGGRWLRSGRR